jgi:superfamily II DNA/RNA helicase
LLDVEQHDIPYAAVAITRCRQDPSMTQVSHHPHSSPPVESAFGELGVPAEIVEALSRQGIVEPFPIQVATVPDSLQGRDVLGRGRTGSGKTLAFCIPTVVMLAASGTRRSPKGPRALVLVPTRELARQVEGTLAPLASTMGLRTVTVVGGVSQGPQVAALRRGVDVCVATPGRLEDLIAQGHVRLDGVEMVVLDEADHMSDLGFLPAMKRLLDQTPATGQRLLFSATLDSDVDVLVRRYLKDPVRRSVDPAEADVPAMTHHLLTVSATDKHAIVEELMSGTGRSLAFTRTKHAARKLARRLSEAGIPAVDLHGNLSQAVRQRNLDAFGRGVVRVMVATDIAARGIHVDDVSLVLHVDPPSEHKSYLHRSGRTARAGSAGAVVTLGTHAQRQGIHAVMRRAKVTPVAASVRPGDARIRELVGPAAARDHRPATDGRPTSRGDSGQRETDGERRGRQRPHGGSKRSPDRRPSRRRRAPAGAGRSSGQPRRAGKQSSAADPSAKRPRSTG